MYDGESFIHSSGGRATPDSVPDVSRISSIHSHPKKVIYRTFELLCVSEEAELSSLIKKLGAYLADQSNLPAASVNDGSPVSAIDANLRASIQAWFARVVHDAMGIKGKVVEKVVQQERAVLDGTVHSSLVAPGDEGAMEEKASAGGLRPATMSENAQSIEAMVSSLTVSALLGRGSHAAVETIIGDLTRALAESDEDRSTVERLLSPFSAASAFIVGKSLLVRDLAPASMIDNQRRYCSFLFLARAAHSLSTACIASEASGGLDQSADERILYTASEKGDDFFAPELFFYLASVLLSYLQQLDDVVEHHESQRLEGSPSTLQDNTLVSELNALCTYVPNPGEDMDTKKKGSTLCEDLVQLRTRVESRLSQVILSGLYFSQGNHAGCWMQMSSALARQSGRSDDDQQEVGAPSICFSDRDLDELDCLVEAIRCGGGFEGCDGASPRVGEAWLNLALSFHPTEATTVAIPRHAIPYKLYASALKVSPTRASFPGVSVVAVDRKTCLGKSLCNSENQKEAYLWLELARSLKLEISSSATEIPEKSTPQEEAPYRLRLICKPEEEKVTVKMDGRPSSVTRVTALTYALALEPQNVDAWLRLAMSVEDEPTVRWRLAGDAIQLAREKSLVLREDIHPDAVDIVVDPAVYTRVLFPTSDDDAGFCVGKMEALLSCAKYEAQTIKKAKDRNPRVWLSIGTLLAERQLMERRVQQLRRHSGRTDLLPETPFFTAPISGTTDEKPFTVRLPKSLLPGDPIHAAKSAPALQEDETEGPGEELIVVNADLAFQMAVLLQGRIRGTIQQWCEAKGYPTPEWI